MSGQGEKARDVNEQKRQKEKDVIVDERKIINFKKTVAQKFFFSLTHKLFFWLGQILFDFVLNILLVTFCKKFDVEYLMYKIH